MSANTYVPLGTLGQIVSWRAPSEVRFADLKSAMAAAGVDEKMPREMLPRHGFSRAARRMKENRIIRQVSDESDVLTFQFTKEYLSGGEYQYATETKLELNKTSGKVACPDAAIGALAQKLLDAEMSVRKANDVTRLIVKIFNSRKADLIQIREQGGCYFVPDQHNDLVEQLDTLLGTIGGGLRRFKVSADGASTSKSVAESMNDHFETMLKEFRDTCNVVSEDAPEYLIKRRQTDLVVIRGKLEAYKDILQDYAKTIGEGIEVAEKELVARMEGKVVEVPAVDLSSLGIPELNLGTPTPATSQPVLPAASDPMKFLEGLCV